MIVRDKMLGSVVVSLVFLSGCSAPTATLDLLTVARKGISSAADEEAHQHREIVKRLAAQMAALDSAFDADVRLVGAGQIRTGEGTPVELSPELLRLLNDFVIANGNDLMSLAPMLKPIDVPEKHPLQSICRITANFDVLAARKSAATLDLTNGTYDNYMLIVEVDASAMDVANSEEWLTMRFTDPGGATGNVTVIAILEPRYTGNLSATALT